MIAMFRKVLLYNLTNAVLQRMVNVVIASVLVIAKIIEGIISIFTQFKFTKPMSRCMIVKCFILRLHQYSISVTQSYTFRFLVLDVENTRIRVNTIVGGSPYPQTGVLVIANS